MAPPCTLESPCKTTTLMSELNRPRPIPGRHAVLRPISVVPALQGPILGFSAQRGASHF